MVDSGGPSVDVSEQPAVRIRRISTIVRKIYCRIAIERLLSEILLEKPCVRGLEKQLGRGCGIIFSL
jgi:hypothetical protein